VQHLGDADVLRGAHSDPVFDGRDDCCDICGGEHPIRAALGLLHRLPQRFGKLVKVELHFITVASWIPRMVALFGAEQVESDRGRPHRNSQRPLPSLKIQTRSAL